MECLMKKIICGNNLLGNREMPFTLRDLGLNIKKTRESRESRKKPGKPMLQYELAQAAGIPASSLSNIEKGKYRNPTWRILTKIADGLGCEISEFFADEKKKISASHLALDEMIDMIVKEKLERLLQEKIRK
jgi:transcriptional regulator with XRE-family HTH domain